MLMNNLCCHLAYGRCYDGEKGLKLEREDGMRGAATLLEFSSFGLAESGEGLGWVKVSYHHPTPHKSSVHI